MSWQTTPKAAACLLLAAVVIPASLSPGFQAPSQSADPLAALNDASRAAYRSAREDALRHCGPVLLVEWDNLVLRYGTQRREAPIIPARYHVLKAVSHVPLALYSLLSPATEANLDAARLYDLRCYREQVQAAKAALAGRGLAQAQLDRQNEILDACLDFLTAVLQRQRVAARELTCFTCQLRPLLDANTRDAARLELTMLHEQVGKWRATLTDEEWKRVSVIVLGSQMPRRDNLAVQYFARLLGEPGEGRRILYAEGLGDEQRALDLLGTHLVDTRIGAAFFDDPARMYRDLLGDAAKEVLDELFRGSRP